MHVCIYTYLYKADFMYFNFTKTNMANAVLNINSRLKDWLRILQYNL